MALFARELQTRLGEEAVRAPAIAGGREDRWQLPRPGAVMSTIRERLGDELFLLVAGPDGPRHRERIGQTPGPRWFSPESPIAQVHGDAAMFVGGIRALLLQALHPTAMRAVAEHSGFRSDMWGRLARTSRFVAITTYGTAADAQAAVDAVRSIHDRVTGMMPDGTPYSASDPHLLLWVHLAEIDSFLRAYTRYGTNTLGQAERDQYVAQTAEIALRLGAEQPPETEAELNHALTRFRPELRGTPEAREAVRHVLLKPPLPLLARSPYLVLAAAAIELLPWWTRRHLRLPLLPISERTVVRLWGGAATAGIRWAMSPVPRPRTTGSR